MRTAARLLVLSSSLLASANTLAGQVSIDGPGAPGSVFAEIADAMNWVASQPSNNYTVRAASGRYAAFDFAENATLSWGSSPGVIDIGGNLWVRPSGQMLFEIAGTDNSGAPTGGPVQCDTVLVNGGNVLYEGRLSIVLLGGFTPTLGDSFELIAATGSVTWNAASATVVGPALGNGLFWQVTVGASSFGTPAGYGTFSNALIATVVPAPGAIALLAAAGLISTRRRR